MHVKISLLSGDAYPICAQRHTLCLPSSGRPKILVVVTQISNVKKLKVSNEALRRTVCSFAK